MAPLAAVTSAAAKAAEAGAVPASKRVCWRKAFFSKSDGATAPARSPACGSEFKHSCDFVVILSAREPQSYQLPPVRRLSGSDGKGLLRPPIA